MGVSENHLLIINGGSSSIKFAIYNAGPNLVPVSEGSIDNINTPATVFNNFNHHSQQTDLLELGKVDFKDASYYLIDWLQTQKFFTNVKAIGHRLVHGMKYSSPQLINPSLLQELRTIAPYDPEHLPGEIQLIELFAERFPALSQIGCFDTAFHTTMPKVAKLLAIPRKFFNLGVYRYGFHGLSYEYLFLELDRVETNAAAKRKVIIAHLGNGASLAALKNGASVDTTMGFTPASGLIMGTRTGDIDPGIAWYLLQDKKMTLEKYSHLINHESGLLGVSGTSSNMAELIKNKNTDKHAAEAFELFCYQTKKYIGAYAAALEGLDTLIFSGGIGEHSPEVRSQVCDGLEFLGIELDEVENMNNRAVISKASSRITVRVIPTNEQFMIAKLVVDTLNDPSKN